MKIIGRAGGISALRESQEEYMPERMPPVQDIINLIRTTYQFVSFPVFGPGMPLNAPWVFAGGRFTDGEQTFSVSQLVMLTEGDIVATSSTSDSDLVLDHLCDLMNKTFGYRLHSTDKKRSYLSTIVVEFDKTLSEYIDKLSRMEDAVNRNRQSRLPFKGLSFGADATLTAQDNPLIRVETADFTIERRVGRAINRYFCNAPMSTEDHVRTLEEIEAIAREGAVPIIGTRPA